VLAFEGTATEEDRVTWHEFGFLAGVKELRRNPRSLAHAADANLSSRAVFATPALAKMTGFEDSLGQLDLEIKQGGGLAFEIKELRAASIDISEELAKIPQGVVMGSPKGFVICREFYLNRYPSADHESSGQLVLHYLKVAVERLSRPLVLEHRDRIGPEYTPHLKP